MSINASISSPDIDRQVQVLKYFPKITAKHYRPALNISTAAVAAVIRPQIPRATGRAQQEFGTKVSGKNIENLKGQIGWFDPNDPWYINIVEYGAGSHPLTSGASTRSKRDQAQFQNALAAGSRFGKAHVFIRGAGWRTMDIHPGFSKRGFMAAGWAATQPLVDKEMSAAGDKVVAELAAI